MKKYILVCDHCGNESEDIEPVGLIWNGVKYTPDYCKTDRGKLETALGKFIEKMPAGASQMVGTLRGTSVAGPSGLRVEWQRRVREWALKAGHNVSDRGRISATIIEAYENTHPDDQQPE